MRWAFLDTALVEYVGRLPDAYKAARLANEAARLANEAHPARAFADVVPKP